MSRDIGDLQPKVQDLCRLLISKAQDAGMLIMVTQTLRTYAEQDAMYAEGRTVPGKIITHAQGGQSFHNFGLAFDCVFLDPNDESKITYTGPWADLGAIAEQIGLVWGGSWLPPKTDEDHFQLAGLTLAEAQRLYGPQEAPVSAV